jgi:hypothetical protein
MWLPLDLLGCSEDGQVLNTAAAKSEPKLPRLSA